MRKRKMPRPMPEPRELSSKQKKVIAKKLSRLICAALKAGHPSHTVHPFNYLRPGMVGINVVAKRGKTPRYPDFSIDLDVD